MNHEYILNPAILDEFVFPPELIEMLISQTTEMHDKEFTEKPEPSNETDEYLERIGYENN